MRPPRLRYVALGDSYTIGTSVAVVDRWPDRLVAALADAGVDGASALDLVANLAVNASTSADVVARELPRFEQSRPGFASLLVGVNDVVRGVPAGEYDRNVRLILDGLLARLPPTRIVVVTTPDYTVTPAGADFGEPAGRRAGIEMVNAIIREAAAERGIAAVDVVDLSRRAAAEPALVAADGLHPSGEQYATWVDRIAPVVRRLLAERADSAVSPSDG
ncbi:MAG: hypothetical protein IVW53_08695 [Chloroflexi bacterium]|nr:hypothetical protein [Chloroflexota bacterium]